MTARCIFANLNFYFAFVVQRKTKSRHRFLLEIDEFGQMNASIDSFQCISAYEILKITIDFSLINYKSVSIFQASEVMLPKINS